MMRTATCIISCVEACYLLIIFITQKSSVFNKNDIAEHEMDCWFWLDKSGQNVYQFCLIGTGIWRNTHCIEIHL